MELLSVQRARSIWLFDTYDHNPRGKDIGSDLIEWLKKSYYFTKAPANPNDLDDSKAMLFQGGQFRVGRESISVELRLFSDGIVGDTRSSTSDTDSFLSDALQSAAKELSLPYQPDMIRKRLYVSELTVRSAKSISILNPKLNQFASKLTHALGTSSEFELAGIAFWPNILPNPSASVFRFERKYGAEFSDNRYYTRAPLKTNVHLEMLDVLENSIS
jgi:hypothetical protein